jgi:DNA-binding PadR family transcriptional regulator
VTHAKHVEREFLLAFWKLHVLHHAEREPVVGQWMIRELRRHGYEISPGTLYPLLARMEERGWLRCERDPRGGPRARKDYSLTPEGRSVLAQLREQVEELYREVVLGEDEEEGEKLARPAQPVRSPRRPSKRGER